MSKLIAGCTQDNEALGGVAAVELVHLSVVPGGCSSQGRHILNKNHLSSQRREAQDFTRQQFGCQIVKPFHTASHGNRLLELFCAFLPCDGPTSPAPRIRAQPTGSSSAHFKCSQVLSTKSSYWLPEKSRGRSMTSSSCNYNVIYIVLSCQWIKVCGLIGALEQLELVTIHRFIHLFINYS